MTAIERLLLVAEAEVGNSNHTKYGRNLFAAEQSTYWSDLFVDWCFTEAFGSETAKALLWDYFEPFTTYSVDYYKAKGLYYDSPRKGDQIFFKNSSEQICHTGIVYDTDATTVYTIEGDTQAEPGLEREGVFKKQHLRTNRSIAGYVRPDWNKLPADGLLVSRYHWQSFIDLNGNYYKHQTQKPTNDWKVEVISL